MHALLLMGPGVTPDLVADLSEKFEEGEIRVKSSAVRLTGLSAMAERSLLRRFWTAPDLDVLTVDEELSIQDYKLLAVDMDSTLIQNECVDDLASLCGRGDEVAAITREAMQGRLSFDESLIRRCRVFAGVDASLIDEALKAVRPTHGALRLIDFCRHNGLKTYILSGGFTGITVPTAAHFGMDGAYSNVLEIRDGKLTGRVTGPEGGPIQNAAGKKARLLELCRTLGIQPDAAICAGDGANDIDMVGTAGIGVAFHAKPVLRKAARYAIDRAGLDGIAMLFREYWY